MELFHSRFGHFLIFAFTVFSTSQGVRTEEELNSISGGKAEGGESRSNEDKQSSSFSSVHYAYSPMHLTNFALVEQHIYAALGSYEQTLLQRLEIVRKYRWDYEDAVIKSLGEEHLHFHENSEDEGWTRASHLASHPLLVYRMLRRSGIHMKQLYEDLQKNVDQRLLEKLEGWRGRYYWPSIHDVEDAAKGLFRLQEVYNIPPFEFGEGVLHGVLTRASLNAYQLVELAEVALLQGDTLTAGEWLKAARQKISTKGDTSIEEIVLNQHWDRAVRMHGKIWSIDDFNIVDIFHDSKLALESQHESQKFNLSFDNRIHNFKALCRGEVAPQMIGTRLSSRLKCFLLRNSHPYFLINPQWVEVHSSDPFVVEVHSFFGYRMIQDVSNVVFYPLLDAAEHGAIDPTFVHSATTTPTWIYENPPSMVKYLKKLEGVLRHPVLDQEKEDEPLFHVRSFSVGNCMTPCLPCEEEIPGAGQRLWTAEFNLDDVEVGGDTVFTHIGLRIPTHKGSVLLIHEQSDFRRLRGNCPIILGQKWVASKLIYERSQCSLLGQKSLAHLTSPR